MESGLYQGEFRAHRKADDSSWCLHGYRINVPSLMRGAFEGTAETCNMEEKD